MGICPYCKQYIDLHNVIIEKKGKGVEDQDRIYVCPFCDYILGFSYAIRSAHVSPDCIRSKNVSH